MPSPTLLSRRMTRLSALVLACSVFAVAGCSDDETTGPIFPPQPVRTVVVTPRVSEVAVGQTVTLAAELRNENDQPISGGTVTWTTGDATVATVSPAGVVTVVGPGAVAIRARIGNYTGFGSVTAVVPVNSIVLTIPSAPIQVGLTAQAQFSTLDAKGAVISRAVTFTSSDPTVATVTGTGAILAVGPGTSTITAAAGGKTATATVTVVAPAPVATVTVTPTATALQPGGSQQLTAVLRDAAGVTLSGRTVTWTSSNPAVATVTNAGLVNVLTAGQATITATSEGKTGTATIGNTINAATNYTIGGALNSDLSYTFNVPAGITSVTVATTGTGGSAVDPDIEVYRAGSTTRACVSETAGPNETCTIPTNGVTGLYRVRVIGFTAYSNVTLRVTLTP